MILIILGTKSRKNEVIAFIKELKQILDKEDFDLSVDLVLVKRNKLEDVKHSTPYTLTDLEYDTEDVVERLKELTLEEYSETKIDKDDLDPPLLFVFGKYISSKLVYIKLKVKGDREKRVICVSFHYARDPMEFPYA